ncbi:MAG: hypothetical protein FWD68_12520 [Alphaproteobacteria bacterium]|nr:hypothetical protein [Alphaproteobacteria bacterium]
MKRLAIVALLFSFFTPACRTQTISIFNYDPGAFAVLAHGGDVSLSSNVDVQQLIDGRWRHVDNVKLLTCSKSNHERVQRLEERCITLRDGETLVPPPWTGDQCEPQCILWCHIGDKLPPGTFRFVVTLCHGIDTTAGPPFEMLSVRNPR